MLSGLPEHQEVVAVFSSSMQPGTDTAGLCPAGHHPHPCSVLLAGCCRALPCPFALGPWLASTVKVHFGGNTLPLPFLKHRTVPYEAAKQVWGKSNAVL